ncbi:hypothetical protein [Kitasatospora sp. A2-31]|uniref:hypothetical protein n=1 Tax=Kitasatospora sp. A2-31 TaxID=2916414 RepID=UPI001EE87DE3|nr:hypothetical protein [Kitasatospora sp. A2-31]MCG6493401.1 hypothetical protein [Kitasatospora sp. A2-31]
MSDQPNAPLDLDAIKARVQAATPGPWRWRGNTEARHLRLQTPHRGGLTVMDFKRWGMQGARPRFARDYVMHPADEMVEYEVAAWSEHIYRKDVVGIDHPDAQFIAAARTDVPALVAEVERLTAELVEMTDLRDRAIAKQDELRAERWPAHFGTPHASIGDAVGHAMAHNARLAAAVRNAQDGPQRPA